MMRKIHNERAIFTLGLVSVIATWSIFGVVSWAVLGVKQDIATLVAEGMRVNAENQAARVAFHTLSDTADLRARLAEYIVSGDDDVLLFIDELEDIAHRAGVSFTLRSLRSEERDGHTALSVDMTSVGTWSHVLTFIALLETYPGNIEMSQVSMQYIEDGAEGDVDSYWKADSVFYLKSYRE
jgi:hypothetical protein